MKIYKIIIVLLLASLVLILMNSCNKPNEETITKSLSVENFESINVKSFGDFLVKYGNEPKIIFNGSTEVLNTLDINVINNQLVIDNKNLKNSKNLQSEFIITIPKIKAINIDGSADFVINEFLQTEDLNIDVSGNGTFKIHSFKNTKKLNITVSGNAEVEMLEDFGSLESLSINISGNGDYSGYLTKATACKIDVSGSADIKVWASDRLAINVSGNADIYYKGDPSVVSNITGIADLVEQN